MRVRIDYHEARLPAGGARVFLGDSEHEVPELSKVSFEHQAGKFPVLKLEVNALDGCDLTLPDAQVLVEFAVYPGYELVAEELGDGRRRWYARERPKSEVTL